MLLDDEKVEHFEALREQLRLELKPVGVREDLCVDRLAAVQWRLMRVPGYEAAILEWIKQSDDNPAMYRYNFGLLAVAFPKDGFAKMDRHEAHLARQVQEILKQLATLQRERLAGAAEAALNVPSVEQVIGALMAASATQLMDKVIERPALPGPQVEKPEPVAEESNSDYQRTEFEDTAKAS
jgi:hypothetical protein